MANVTTFLFTSESPSLLRSVTKYLLEIYPSIFSRIYVTGKVDEYSSYIACGIYEFKFNEVDFRVVFSEAEKATAQQNGIHIYRKIELSVPTANLAVFDELMKKIHEHYIVRNDDQVLVYVSDRYGDWGEPLRVNKRKMSTVFLQDGILEVLMNDLTKFFKSENLYRKYECLGEEHIC